MGIFPLHEIHRFWFGRPTKPDDFPEGAADIWYRKSGETDRTIRERFEGFLLAAAAARLGPAGLAREEAAALVVLYDQFPRNLFRERPEAFAHDAMARDVAHALVEGGLDRFFWLERAAIVMPFEHGEDVADQDRAVALFGDMAVNAPASMTEFFRNLLDYATRHRDIIRRFGRFPHRNAILGRRSTPDEEGFLKQPGSSF